jgi:hypothetical protein
VATNGSGPPSQAAALWYPATRASVTEMLAITAAGAATTPLRPATGTVRTEAAGGRLPTACATRATSAE